MSISKSTRFEIFKRDNFTCQYCGRQTPLVILEVDHIIPKAGGGTDDPNNLVTACRDCNRGKGAIPLSVQRIQDTRKEEIAREREKQEQIEAYEDFLLLQHQKESQTIEELVDYWASLCDHRYRLNTDQQSSLGNFLKKLTPLDIREAMSIASQRVRQDPGEGRFRYFCGICHNKISEKTGDSGRRIFGEVLRYYRSQRRGSGYYKEHILKQLCSRYAKDVLIEAIDIAFSQHRGSYWKAFCEALSEVTGDDISS